MDSKLSLLQNCDLLLFKAGKFPSFGYFIGKYTNSKWSHIALCYIEEKEYCLEFREFKGCRFYRIKQYLIEGAEIDVFRVIQIVEKPIYINGEVKSLILNFTEEVKQKILNKAKSMINNKYNWGIIWKVMKTYIPFLRLLPRQSRVDVNNYSSFDCSAFISYLFSQYYIDPCSFKNDTFTVPDDLAQSPIFTKLFTLTAADL